MYSKKMTPIERRAVVSLSSIMALRMIGLFMVLPIFSLYASQLKGATPFLIGLALGIYGLTQALFQIPFGALSDRWGRKPIITLGLLLFAAGSLLAALSHSIFFMIIGRALQGTGAVGSTILALISDLTREHQRTKAMAISGITIGFSFSVAMFLGPILAQWTSVNHLFLIALVLALISIFILHFFVPVAHRINWHRDTSPQFKSFLNVLTSPSLLKLNSGIFLLHAIFTASFIVVPISLYQFAGFVASRQWLLYLPTLLIAFVLVLVLIGFSERKQKVKPFFLVAIMMLALAEIMLWQAPKSLLFIFIGLSLFFVGFSLLEAFLPSLISKTAPAHKKGSALGIYSCAQFLGIFVGGLAGGWVYGQFSFSGVYLFCIMLTLLWLSIALLMQPPRSFITQMLHLPPKENDWHAITKTLQIIPGIVEVTIIAEENIVYLKMERGAAKHPDFIRLQEQLIRPKEHA